MNFNFVERHNDNVLKPCTQGKIESFIDSEKVKKLVLEYRETGDEEKKMSLPAILWNAFFSQDKYDAHMKKCKEMGETPKPGTRKKEYLIPSGLLMMDFDDVSDPMALHQRILENIPKMGMEVDEVLGLSHITPGGQGLHIVVKRERGLTIAEEMMKWGDIALHRFDPKCKDLTRLSFVPIREDVLYYNPQLLFTPILDFPEDPEITTKQHLKKEARTTTATPTRNKVQPTPNQKNVISEKDDKVLKTLTKMREIKLGGPAVEGCRHSTVLDMAVALRGHMSNDVEVMEKYIPSYGLPQSEYDAILKYAAENCDNKFETYQMKKDKEAATRLIKENEIENSISELPKNVKLLANFLEYGEQPKLPKHLPEPIRIITDTLPKQTKGYGAVAVFAPLGLYMKNTKIYHGRDGFIEPSVMVISVAMSSTGKSDINRIKDFILEPIQKLTDENLARLEKYNIEVSRLSKNAPRPAEPKNMVMQIVPDNMTEAAKLKWLKWAAPYRLFVYAPEMERLYKLNDSKKQNFWSDVKICFDNGMVGAARASVDAVQGCAKLRMNWIAHATPAVFYKHLTQSGSISDGALSRLTVAKLEKEDINFDESSRIKDVTDNDSDAMALRGYIQRLSEASDQNLHCEEAVQWQRNELKRYQEYEKAVGFKYLSCIYIRAITSGLFRAMMLWVMNGKVWTQEIADFATWSVDYDMWGKISIFGEAIKKEFEYNNNILSGKKRTNETLELLPANFNLEDLCRIREMFDDQKLPEKTLIKRAKSQVQQWVSRGHVEYANSEKTRYVKV
jgi:hypothetical protein